MTEVTQLFLTGSGYCKIVKKIRLHLIGTVEREDMGAWRWYVEVFEARQTITYFTLFKQVL